VIEECGKLTGTRHNLRKRKNINYNETQMAKKIMMNVESQSTQPARFASEEVAIYDLDDTSRTDSEDAGQTSSSKARLTQ
ncbi:16660_t:CDS:2, partial [Funneliformis caledonium]